MRVERADLVLDTMTRERSERGKPLIDTVQDVEAALREHTDRKETDLPDDVQREVIGNLLHEHYEKWLDEPLPALGNKSRERRHDQAWTRAGRGAP